MKNIPFLIIATEPLLDIGPTICPESLITPKITAIIPETFQIEVTSNPGSTTGIQKFSKIQI